MGMRLRKSPILGIYNKAFSFEPYIPPGISLMAAQKMWPTTQGKGMVVAVVDTGIDYLHPDLKNNLVGGKSFVPAEKDYMDLNGHGTHVAGIIAANGKILGMAPEAGLLAVKVLNRDGVGTNSSIIQGLAWARRWEGDKGQRVNVINLSLGGPFPNKALHNEIIKAVNAGITVVCAAGNAGDANPDTSEISYPAYYLETLAVGAINLQTGIADFSNSNDRIDVVAPGVDTYSTYPDNSYVKLSGTSMAAPHLSGAVALITSRYLMKFNQLPTPDYIRSYLHMQAVDLGDLGFDNLYGYGLFTFNTDGGKAIKLIIDQRKYYLNNKEQQLKKAPFVHEGEPVASIREICDLLSTGSMFIPPDGSEDNPTGQVEIWS